MGFIDTIAAPFLPAPRGAGPEDLKGIGKRGALISPHFGTRYAGEPIWKSWTNANAVKNGYIASEWVKACVDSIATPAASVPWRVSRFKSEKAKKAYQHEVKGLKGWEQPQFIKELGDLGLEPEPDHPLETLIDNPNPVFTWHDMFERFTQHLLLAGNAYFHINRGSLGRQPLEIWPVDPDGIKIEPSMKNVIDHYEYHKGDVHVPTILPQDMIHVMLPDPANPLYGVSVLQSAARVVDTDVEAVNFNKVLLQNMASPSGILAFKRQLTDKQWEDARAQLQEEYAGAKNAGRPMVLGNEATWMRTSLSPEELNFLASRKMNRESIAAVFRVNLAILGLGDLTKDAYDRARLWHHIDTVIPYLDRMQAHLNMKLARDFGEDILLWYDTSNIEALTPLFNEKIMTAKVIWTMGVPFQEINQRLRLGFPKDIEGSDVGYLPASGLAVVGAEPVGQDPQDPNKPNQGDPNSAPDGGTAVTDQGGDSSQEGPKQGKGENFATLDDEDTEALRVAKERWGL